MRASSGGTSNRRRALLVVAAVALVILITSLRGLANFYTGYLWFDSLDLGSVWRRIIWAQLALGALFTAVFFVMMWVNLWFADRLGPDVRPLGPEEELVERYHALVGRRSGLVRIVVSFVLALIAGVGVSAQWENWLLFTNSEDFGVRDALFNRDVGFYVFQLPFLTYLVSWLFAAFLIIFIISGLAHYLNGGIRIQQSATARVSAAVKGHLSLLLGLMALTRAAGYWLDQFELTFSTRGFIDGASYTDVQAQLPAIRLLMIISLFMFVLLIINIWRRGFTFPVLAVGLWAVVATLAGTAYPAAIQRLVVEPDESNREAPYIERNIEATRAAYGLDAVVSRNFAYEEELTAQQVVDNLDTVTNVRLLDPNIIDDTFNQLQGIRGFYQFRDVDVDRYEVDGRITQVVLSARELLLDGLPNRSWESEHVAFTHGYSLAVAPANSVESGRPAYLVGDIPTVSPENSPQLTITQPGLYFGEDIGGYAVVGAQRDEVDFQTLDDTTQTTRYDGDGGVAMGGFLRRAAYALKFADSNLLISGQIQSESRIIYVRDIRDRVETLAPFLDYDADPYPAIVDGQVVWILDAYTTTNRYPYSQRAATREVSTESGLLKNFNYVRNSVKAVVDAFDGSVTFYVIDDTDPLVRSYVNQFPDLFSAEAPSDALKAQFRYPEDLFRVQTNMWGRYRIDGASEFYTAAGQWEVAQDPGDTIGAVGTTSTIDDAGVITSSEERIDPQYLLMRLPGDTEQRFLNFRPFVPFSADDSRKDLSGFMIAHSDPDKYGQIEVFEIPPGIQVDGPSQFNSNILTERDISETITLLNDSGSSVRPGNLLLVPIENSLVYVRPLFVEATGGTAFPELSQVIVGLGDQVIMRPTYQEALAALIPGLEPDMIRSDLEFTPIVDPVDPADPVDPDPADPPTDTTVAPPTTQPTIPDDATADELLDAAASAFDDADRALRLGDLAGYQDAVSRAEELLLAARDRLTEERLSTEPDPVPTTTTTAPESA